MKRPPSLVEARARIREAVAAREDRFLAGIDRLVWSEPSSLYLPLLRHAGVERGDLITLVRGNGLDGALERLRDAGVYVTHEEWSGRSRLRRGTFELELSPARFANPMLPATFFGGSGGSSGPAVPVRWSFATLRRGIDPYVLRASTWNVMGTPAAIWLPNQPSAVGIATALTLAASGAPPERWFTPVRAIRRTPPKLLATNVVLPAMVRSAGIRVPRPRHASLSDPSPVLRWCRDALARAGRVRLGGYTSTIVRLAEVARAEGVSLAGLVVATLGEPLGSARADAIRASGAEPANGYGFIQKGTVAHACPACGDEELHVLESEVAVIGRRRLRPDGMEVSAFLWTSLDDESPGVFLNVENDDYGRITVDRHACDCELGVAGVRRRVASIRGMTKITAEGMTVPAEVLERLVDSVLPSTFGGGPADYQFVQEGTSGESRLLLRIDPRVGAIDDAEVQALMERELRATPASLLASELWSQTQTFRPVRIPPEPTASGKVLPVSVAPPE